MFEGMKEMGKLLKQAKDMKSKMKDMQNELKGITITESDRKNNVTISINGELQVQSVTINNPSLLAQDQKSNLENSLTDAMNNAINKSKNLATEKLSAISGGLNIPGLT